MIYPNGPFPQEFGRYSLVSYIGGGGMGAVYRALDKHLERHVALKIPHPHLLTMPQSLERFYREARTAARLSHPNLCQVLDIGQWEGIHFLTMNYIEGESLDKRPPPEIDAVISLVRKLALAMAEAHRLGVIHRDLKPANIIIRPDGEPVITDFGLALRLDAVNDALTDPGGIVGTPMYMGPEQIQGERNLIGPACDVYSLGVIFYELLTGHAPFTGTPWQLFHQIFHQTPDPPTQRRPEIGDQLSNLCLRAMAKSTDERIPSMTSFAAALADCRASGASPPTVCERPKLRRDTIRFAFIGMGSAAPALMPPNRLFLDVGNDLRPGVIDHHHLMAFAGSTASLVRSHPRFIDGAVAPHLLAQEPFTIVLHEKPDLDAVVASYLTVYYLSEGAFPPGADTLARYVDKIDEGAPGMSQANPFTLYSAYLRLVDRNLKQLTQSPMQCWQECIRGGLELVDYAIRQMIEQCCPLMAVDVFACSKQFNADDRRVVLGDIERYWKKLADTRCRARRRRLKLPGQYGGWVEVESLRIRDVQNADDPERVIFFKDWARSDQKHCPNRRGFDALCVFMSEGPRQARRCIISVTPDSAASLRGLGEILEAEESRRRVQINGADNRVTDPATGKLKQRRPGYANTDPWYDGRSHGFTIVDSPNSGTVLSADEIEAIFQRFGGHEPRQKRDSADE